MEIDVTENGTIKLKEIFNHIEIETENGNRFVVVMRDNNLEIGVRAGNDGFEDYFNWFITNNGDIKKING